MSRTFTPEPDLSPTPGWLVAWLVRALAGVAAAVVVWKRVIG